MPRTRAISITGLGCITPIGDGVPAFTRALREGRSGTRLLPFAEPRMASTVGATCDAFDPGSALSPADQARLPRLIPMALAAAREALAQARLPLGDALEARAGRRIGLILGTGGGGIDFTLEQAAAGYAGRALSLWTITNATHGNLAGELSIRLGLRGPSLCISTGCASSSDAVGLAMDLLRSDRPGAPDTIVAVGADAHVRWETIASMELLRVISTRRHDAGTAPTASRPFDRSRDGFVLGEGAWAAVLDRPRAARAREAEPIAHLEGYGATCDAFHRVRPAPDAAEGARAILDALADAGRRPEEVEVVQYHGTATRINDALEARTIRLALGDHAGRLRGHAVKSMIGHPQGAGGLAGLVATIAGLTAQDNRLGDREGAPFIHPTINLHDQDPECDLDATPNAAATTSARIALVNCLAFGAKNSALVASIA